MYIYLLTGMIYGDELDVRKYFINELNGIVFLFNMLIREEGNYKNERRLLNIMADLTKAAIQQIISTSDLTQEQQEAKIKALLSQMRTFLGDSVITFVDTNGQYVTTSVNNLQDFNNMSTSSFLEVMRIWSEDCNNAFTRVDKR
jgi:hypothetical protein